MTEIDMSKLYEVDHKEDFTMTPEQFQLNIARKLARLGIMAEQLQSVKPSEKMFLEHD